MWLLPSGSSWGEGDDSITKKYYYYYHKQTEMIILPSVHRSRCCARGWWRETLHLSCFPACELGWRVGLLGPQLSLHRPAGPCFPRGRLYPVSLLELQGGPCLEGRDRLRRKVKIELPRPPPICTQTRCSPREGGGACSEVAPLQVLDVSLMKARTLSFKRLEWVSTD